jgi:hypothetical protein
VRVQRPQKGAVTTLPCRERARRQAARRVREQLWKREQASWRQLDKVATCDSLIAVTVTHHTAAAAATADAMEEG